jgi:hypothetical protein
MPCAAMAHSPKYIFVALMCFQDNWDEIGCEPVDEYSSEMKKL